MEARAFTQLGENVKLLIFISIFFLPLGLCMVLASTSPSLTLLYTLTQPCFSQSIWSINETYSRQDYAIVTTLVAVTTCLVTLNLNNLIFILHKLYAPRRLALAEEMEKKPNWNTMGNRFKACQRSQPGERASMNHQNGWSWYSLYANCYDRLSTLLCNCFALLTQCERSLMGYSNCNSEEEEDVSWRLNNTARHLLRN